MSTRTVTNPDAAVKWYRQKYMAPSSLTDHEIYEHLKKQFPDKDFVDNPYQFKSPEVSVPDKQTLEDSYNPGAIEKLFTMNLSGAFAEESDWWAKAYNQSVGGMIYEIKYGEKRFKTEDIDYKWYDEAGQFFAGLMSPVDIATFFGSASIGSIASKAVTHGPLRNMAVRGLTSLVGKQGFKSLASKKFASKLAVGAGIDSGFSLATYGAASAALQDAATQ